jgi:hypothetical protein
MRFVKWFHLLFLLSLALGLFCGELGESVRLADDVSNDLVVSAAPSSKCVEMAQPDVISRQGIMVFEESTRGPAVIPSTALAIPSAQDLLRLLSIQRR